MQVPAHLPQLCFCSDSPPTEHQGGTATTWGDQDPATEWVSQKLASLYKDVNSEQLTRLTATKDDKVCKAWKSCVTSGKCSLQLLLQPVNWAALTLQSTVTDKARETWQQQLALEAANLYFLTSVQRLMVWMQSWSIYKNITGIVA